MWFFLLLQKNICCVLIRSTLPRQSASNEYHNTCFYGGIRKISVLFGWKKKALPGVVQLTNTTMWLLDVFDYFQVYLRNRSALARICWVINHWLEVSCKVDEMTSMEHEWLIYLQLTEKLWFISQQTTHKSWSISILTHRKWRKSNCILQIHQTFCHRIKKSCQQFSLLRWCFHAFLTLKKKKKKKKKKMLHHLLLWQWRLMSAKCQNDVGMAYSIVARFRPVICSRINHWFSPFSIQASFIYNICM